jgi:hypothetical protein
MSEEQTLEQLLNDIILKCGAYSSNPLQHAENIMEKASSNAKKIKQRLIDSLRTINDASMHNKAADCGLCARVMLEQLGEKEP